VGAGEGEWGKRGRRRAGEGMGAEEEILVGVYEEVLKREGVGEEESFFELGGHSLLATQVMSRVRKVFGVELGVQVLFESPTVAELAERVRESARWGKAVAGLELKRRKIGRAHV